MAGFSRELLGAVKDYWFLITVIVSAIISVAYMIIFQVNPWDTQREIKHKRRLVQFHTLGGVSLLEAGQFKLAKVEFDAALELAPTREEALNGRYLANLFLAFESPDWDPAVGFAVQDQLTHLIKQQSLQHVIEKYLGDLHRATNMLEPAQRHYERALQLRPAYPDALNDLGWFHYNIVPDIQRMETCFRSLTQTSAYDFRGFHGLGYTLYMRALRETDPDKRTELIQEAAKQSDMAKDLSINRLGVKVDFGEVARSVYPDLSVFFHSVAMDMLDDPTLSGVNPELIDAKLLKISGEVRIKGKDQVRAWINYQLALDHLAMFRLGYDAGGETAHSSYLQKARAQDASEEIFPIYSDQLAILDFLIGAEAVPSPTKQATHA